MTLIATGRSEATVPTTDLKAARRFYGDVLGLPPSGAHAGGVDLVFTVGNTHLMVYEMPGPPPLGPRRTVAHFVVDDVHAAVRELRDRGVEFDEYDTPELKTEDGVAKVAGRDFAWMKDPDGNVLGVHD
jgi:catechol 2,3-dioxygenase-like lactoylglutathione lyase family enzyme